MSHSASNPFEAAADPAGECSFCRDHLGAYSLRSLDRVDQGLIEQHLRWCADCRDELGRHEAIVIGLGLQGGGNDLPADSTWISIRDRIFAASDDEPVLQKAVASGNAVQPTVGSSRNRWMPLTVIAPLALAVILLSAWSWSLQRDLSATQGELSNHMLLNSTLANTQQVHLYSMEQSCPTCDGVGQVGVSESNAMGMVVGWDFDPQMTHDVWGVDHQGERSRVCSLIVDSEGAVMQMFSFPDAPSKFTDLEITDETGKIVYQSHIMSGEKISVPPVSPTS